MNGGNSECCNGPTNRKKMPQDILLPSLSPGYYQHVGRNPNTNSSVRAWEYRLKKEDDYKLQEAMGVNAYLRDAIMVQYDKHTEKKQLQRQIRDRVQQKLQAYEDTIEKRREKLKELLCNEERKFYSEVIEIAQKGDEMKMEEMKKRAQILKARREEDRLKIVHQKRIDQYRDRCQELRPSLMKKHIIETKNAQFQQIRENEARREADRELDRMWNDLNAKEMRAKMEREEQDIINQKNRQLDLLNVWQKQIKGKELLKAEIQKVAQEDKIEMDNLRDELRREEIEALDAKIRKRNERAKELMEQIASQEQLLAKRKLEEDTLDQAFNQLAELEIQREKQAIKDFTTQAKRETAMYKKHLKELEEERKKEEKELDMLLETYRKEIEGKQDEAKCKILEAKKKLQRNVMEGRAEQLAHKRQQAENQLKLKQAENELLRMAFDKNERLQAESDRLEAEAVRQYRDDLKQQIEYSNLLREREKQELKRQLEEGRKEEEMYQKIVEEMVKGNVESDAKHPFRKVLENYDCRCTFKSPF
ncbi:unnamed protein product [Phaedon cochleariae]|uniref:Trichohyalin-plectin-homology domain-containing protein n=1 Tax=Phaedon cochleariae TaxID=80249 RepID=A0A9P0GNE7_PHACE|nr:unnamed protein product [Phaedon cochleariae]